jgi:hypothetical protein
MSFSDALILIVNLERSQKAYFPPITIWCQIFFEWMDTFTIKRSIAESHEEQKFQSSSKYKGRMYLKLPILLNQNYFVPYGLKVDANSREKASVLEREPYVSGTWGEICVSDTCDYFEVYRNIPILVTRTVDGWTCHQKTFDESHPILVKLRSLQPPFPPNHINDNADKHDISIDLYICVSGFLKANEIKYARMELYWRPNHFAILHAIQQIVSKNIPIEKENHEVREEDILIEPIDCM